MKVGAVVTLSWLGGSVCPQDVVGGVVVEKVQTALAGHAASGFFDCGSCDETARTYAQNDGALK